MRLEGKIISIYKQSNNWACFRFEDKSTKKQYTAKGNFSGILMPGIKITLIGEFVEDEKYGKQIQISEIIMKSSITATFLYKCVKGIGLTLAEEIVTTYGEDCLDKILKDDTLLLHVKGIKQKKYKMIQNSLKSTNNISLYLSIFEYFNNDVTQNQADKIVEVCNHKKITFDKIKKNPYWLIEHINGFGFKKVDKLALSSGLERFSIERIGAAIVYCLQQASQMNGHCYLDMESLSKDVSELILESPVGVSVRSLNTFRKMIDADDENVLNKYLSKHSCSKELKIWKENYYTLIDIMGTALLKNVEKQLVAVEKERIYWVDLYKAELSAAEMAMQMAWEVPVRKISDRAIKKAIMDMEDYEGCVLSEEQSSAVYNSLQNRISIITGGPGRGKTTIIKTIIEAWNDLDNVVLLAPTGRAAKRITESTGYQASTIHRYKNKTIEDGYPEKKLIIVDETSMMGLKLGETVLKIARDCNLILVGDIDQLASVEPGALMKDLIQCGQVEVSRLTKGFRNSGSIAINADLINQGKYLKSFVLDMDTQFVTKEDNELIKEIIDTYEQLIKLYDKKDIGILSPLRSKGLCSVDRINEAIQHHFNPISLMNQNNGSGFLVNDRVMHIKNNYKKEITNELGCIECGIFNGDMGTIEDIDYDTEEVKIKLDDGRTGLFSYSEMKENFIMSYATTIHKSQGSEFKAVILIVSSQHIFILKRNTVYTGISRAKKQIKIVGDEKAIAAAARNIDDSVRNTYLAQRIIEMSKGKK